MRMMAAASLLRLSRFRWLLPREQRGCLTTPVVARNALGAHAKHGGERRYIGVLQGGDLGQAVDAVGSQRALEGRADAANAGQLVCARAGHGWPLLELRNALARGRQGALELRVATLVLRGSGGQQTQLADGSLQLVQGPELAFELFDALAPLPFALRLLLAQTNA